jgi:ATP-binding cassette, subfamily B, multidrug efflux pump
MLRFFETSLDPFREHDESMPPASLIGYYGRYCKQVWPFLVALMTISLIVSLIEVTILRFVGALVDMLRSSSPDEVLKTHGGEFLAMALLILIGRPLASFTHDLIVQQAIAPGMTNLIRWQTHRYVLRQSVSYFANDFAGRIASNIVQAAASLRDSVVQIIDALWFVAVFAFSALFIFAQTDWRLACPLILWILVYVSALFYFVPRIRRRSEALAHMRATLTGRIVDSYTNIQTVKLFAHLERGRTRSRCARRSHRCFSSPDPADHLPESDRFSQQQHPVGQRRRACGLALGARRGVAGRHRGCDRARDPRRAHVGLGDVDLDWHFRQYRTGPGGDANDRAAARAGRSRRRPPA